VIEIKETHQIPRMASILHNLFVRYPFLYNRAFCAAFHPYNLYAIRRLNPRITTAFLFVPDFSTNFIRNASQTPRPVSPLIAHNRILRWMIDSMFAWFGTPIGLKLLGADIACVEQQQINQHMLNSYKEARVVVYAWCVNEPEQRRWLKSNGVSIITDTLFNHDNQ
jgi:glycerophosphoryl diester phosphodiesterase